jgi:hypothetical protein
MSSRAIPERGECWHRHGWPAALAATSLGDRSAAVSGEGSAAVQAGRGQHA